MRRGLAIAVLLAVLSAIAGLAAAAAQPEVEIRTVRGNSMEPLIAPGAAVEIVPLGRAETSSAAAPAAVSSVKHNDVVTARIGNAGVPVMKRVAGVGGDVLALEAHAGDGRCRILVNGAAAMNSAGETYVIGAGGCRMLALYVDDYGGVIPKDAYLLLGDNPRGTRDSTQFGLVHRDDIEGKVVKVTLPEAAAAVRSNRW
jgi:signal peptidase I